MTAEAESPSPVGWFNSSNFDVKLDGSYKCSFFTFTRLSLTIGQKAKVVPVAGTGPIPRRGKASGRPISSPKRLQAGRLFRLPICLFSAMLVMEFERASNRSKIACL